MERPNRETLRSGRGKCLNDEESLRGAMLGCGSFKVVIVIKDQIKAVSELKDSPGYILSSTYAFEFFRNHGIDLELHEFTKFPMIQVDAPKS